jgi:CheY-like chemotaxis protein
MCDILVLDDNPLISKLVTEFLEDEGFEVAEAHTPAEAFDVLRGPPGARLLLADRELNRAPGDIDGFAAADMALRLYPTLRVIYVSGDTEALSEVAPTPRARLLEKPFVSAQLVETVRDLLDA